MTNPDGKISFLGGVKAVGTSILVVFLSSSLASAAGSEPGGAAKVIKGPQAATFTIRVTPQQQASALAYWTRQRVADTPALAMPVDDDYSSADEAALAEPTNLGPEEGTAPGAAAPGAVAKARAAFAEDWAALNESAALDAGAALEAESDILGPPAISNEPTDTPADIMAGTSSVYTFYNVNTQAALQKIYPHQWVGRLTFNTPSGSASCSATAISGNNIVTAAHCIYDTTTNKPYSRWVFTPAYRNGAAPFGTFAATYCTITNNWVNLSGNYAINTWARHDVAVCTLGRNAAGQTLNDAVGFAGRIWNTGNNQLVFNSGYPQSDINGAVLSSPTQYLRSCTAETFLYTTETLGSGCIFGPGISGGSWLVSYKPFVISGKVVSVNSGFFGGSQNLYGARFNSGNIVPLCNARGC